MTDFFKNWTINIVMLALFIVIIEMLLPGGKMKKYVGLLTGTILIIAIIEPIIGLFGKSFDFSAAQTTTAGIISRKEIEQAGKLLEEEQLRQTVELYRGRIIEQIEYFAAEVDGVADAQADIIINEDPDSENFGQIKRIYINAVLDIGEQAGESNSAGGRTAIKIEKIGSINTGGAVREDSGSTVYDQGLERRLSERISEVFGVGKENIIIKQMKR